jgi:hypothetical protein
MTTQLYVFFFQKDGTLSPLVFGMMSGSHCVLSYRSVDVVSSSIFWFKLRRKEK